MKKILILTLMAGTIGQLQASSEPTPSFETSGPTPYDMMPPAPKAELIAAQPIISTIMANKPVALTLPTDLVGVMQQIAVLAQESQTWEPYQIAYFQIQKGWNGPEIQQAMGNIPSFMKLFQQYVLESQQAMEAGYELQLATHSTAPEAQELIQSGADAFKTKCLAVNQAMQDLQKMFKDAYPKFAKFQQKQTQLNEAIAPWIAAFTQLASPQKTTQVTTAVQTAVTIATTSPAVTQAKSGKTSSQQATTPRS